MGRGSRRRRGAASNRRDVDAISFTGSEDVGPAASRRRSRRGSRKVQLEMGGKNPLVVLDDADLGTAVNVALQGAFFSTGQRCTASSRLIVTEGIHERFVAAMIERMKTLKVDDALKAGHRDRARSSTSSSSSRTCEYIEHRAQGGREARRGRRAR